MSAATLLRGADARATTQAHTPARGKIDFNRPLVVSVELGTRALLYWLVWTGSNAVFYGDLADYQRRAAGLGWHHLPYRSVPWEFPPLTLPFMVLARFLTRPDVLVLAFGAVTIGLEYGSLRALRRAWPDQAGTLTRWWLAVVLPAATIAWFRFDFLAVWFATLALVAVEQGRRSARWSVLGAFAKLWPIVGLGVLAARRKWREVVAGAVAMAVGVGAWWLWSPDGLRAFAGYRAGSGLEIESIAGSIHQVTHPAQPMFVSGAWVVGSGGWQWVNSLGMVFLAVAGGLLVCRAARVRGDSVAVGGALVGLVLLVTRLLSAQYVVWLAPFVVVLAAVRHRRRLGLAAVVMSLLTFASMVWWGAVRQARGIGPWLQLGRNVALAWVCAELFVLAARREDQCLAPS